MIFYCIVRSEENIINRDVFRLLKEACQTKGLDFVLLETDKIDYSSIRDHIVPGSLLYRIAGGARPSLLEALLDDKVATLRQDTTALLARSFSWGSAIRLEQANIPIIPTIFNVNRFHDAQLAGYVDKLGGFPTILKSAGGSHGAGVMILDSLASLRSVLDFISDKSTGDLVLRKYIHSARHLRLIVLGDEVIDAIEYKPQPNDFRTNAVHVPEVEKRNDIDPEIQKNAVRAVSTLGLEFGGVDVLIDKDGKHFIAEVNHPCNFARNQMNTGFDVAGAMLDYLTQKQEAGVR